MAMPNQVNLKYDLFDLLDKRLTISPGFVSWRQIFYTAESGEIIFEGIEVLQPGRLANLTPYPIPQGAKLREVRDGKIDTGAALTFIPYQLVIDMKLVPVGTTAIRSYEKNQPTKTVDLFLVDLKCGYFTDCSMLCVASSRQRTEGPILLGIDFLHEFIFHVDHAFSATLQG